MLISQDRSRWAVLIIALASSACQQVEPNTATASAPTAGNNGKIAITTPSEEARKGISLGRDLQEKLRITDSIAHFDKAISLDQTSRWPSSTEQTFAEWERILRSPEEGSRTRDKASNGERC